MRGVCAILMARAVSSSGQTCLSTMVMEAPPCFLPPSMAREGG